MKREKTIVIQNSYPLWHIKSKEWLYIFGFFVHFFSTKLGHLLTTYQHNVSSIWPAAAVSVFIIMVLGQRSWPIIFVSAVISNAMSDIPWWVNGLMAFGNTLQALLGAYGLKKFEKPLGLIGSYWRPLLILFISIVAPVLRATIGIFSLNLGGLIKEESLFTVWKTWWSGDFIGILIFLPLLHSISEINFKWFGENLKVWLNRILFLSAIVSVSVFVFYFESGRPFIFLIYLSLLLAVLFTDKMMIFIITATIATIAVVFTALGFGPYLDGNLEINLIHLQIFLFGFGISSLFLVAIKEEGFILFPSLALISGWILSGAVYYFFYQTGLDRDENQFKVQIKNFEQLLIERLNDYFRIIESGVGLYAASSSVEREEWRDFYSKINLKERYPGMNGVGVIRAVAKEKIVEFEQEQQKTIPYFKVREVPHIIESERPQQGINEPYLVITYIEPIKGNEQALGLIISSEKKRKKSALESILTGQASMSEAIFLVQDEKKRPGFLLSVPIYKKDELLNTNKYSMSNVEGLVYAPVLFENFIQSAFESYQKELQLKMFLKDNLDQNIKVFESAPLQNNSKINPFSRTSILKTKLAGLPVFMEFSQVSSFQTYSDTLKSWVGLIGVLFSLVIAIIISSFQSITRKATDLAEIKTKEILEKEEIWKTLTNSAPVGIFMTNELGEVHFVNQKWCKITGNLSENILGHNWIESVHSEDVFQVATQWEELGQSGKFSAKYRMTKHSEQGVSEILVSGQASQLRDRDGHLTGYIGTIEDITEFHNQQLALAHSSRLTSLGEMAAGVAHEINNPLAIILGKAQVLSRNFKNRIDLSDKEKDDIEKISLTAQRIAAIIRGLRSLSRKESNDSFEKATVKKIFDENLSFYKARFEDHGVKLIVVEDQLLNLDISCRPIQIGQVLLNLLNNAYDAVLMNEDKWVRIELEKNDTHENETIKIKVVDSGKGLKPDLVEKIFQPFYTTKDPGKGTGLGLSLSSKIIEQHHGRLYYDSKAEHTTFVIELPIQSI